MKWYLKQLLPLSYWTKYEQDGKRYFEIWNMWFGVCYNKTRVEVK